MNNISVQLRKSIHANPDTLKSLQGGGQSEKDLLKAAKTQNIHELDMALRELLIMEPDEIKRAIEFRKRKIDKEIDEPEGRQIQLEASRLLKRNICIIIFCLLVVLTVTSACYSHIKNW